MPIQGKALARMAGYSSLFPKRVIHSTNSIKLLLIIIIITGAQIIVIFMYRAATADETNSPNSRRDISNIMVKNLLNEVGLGEGFQKNV